MFNLSFNKRAASVLATMLLCGSVAFGADRTGVVVVDKNGTEKQMELDATGLIFFQENVMKVVPSTSSAEAFTFALPQIAKVLFEDKNGVLNILSDGKMALYPTVAEERIWLANAPRNLVVSIYGSNGVLKKQGTYEEAGIDVSSLSSGIYVLNAGNQNFKFEKR